MDGDGAVDVFVESGTGSCLSDGMGAWISCIDCSLDMNMEHDCPYISSSKSQVQGIVLLRWGVGI